MEEAPATADGLSEALLQLIVRVASRQYVPRLYEAGNTDFQLTRGWLGLSL